MNPMCHYPHPSLQNFLCVKVLIVSYHLFLLLLHYCTLIVKGCCIAQYGRSVGRFTDVFYGLFELLQMLGQLHDVLPGLLLDRLLQSCLENLNDQGSSGGRRRYVLEREVRKRPVQMNVALYLVGRRSRPWSRHHGTGSTWRRMKHV